MTRAEIIQAFRIENPELTTDVVTDAQLYNWCKVGDKEICAFTRCIIDQNGTAITPILNDQYYDLTVKISKFYDIDELNGGGVLYNNKKLLPFTIARLDEESPNWRTATAGTPTKYYRRGKYIYFNRPIDANVYTIRIYSVLISDDFDHDNKTPFNQLTYLEPFHYAVVLYLQKKAKMKVGETGEEIKAQKEYTDYLLWMKKEIGGGKFGPIFFQPKI